MIRVILSILLLSALSFSQTQVTVKCFQGLAVVASDTFTSVSTVGIKDNVQNNAIMIEDFNLMAYYRYERDCIVTTNKLRTGLTLKFRGVCTSGDHVFFDDTLYAQSTSSMSFTNPYWANKRDSSEIYLIGSCHYYMLPDSINLNISTFCQNHPNVRRCQ